MTKHKKLIVSLTSHPGRIRTTWLSIESMLEQTKKPDKIVLNLAIEDFPNGVDDERLLSLCEKGLIIEYTENYRVATKLLPTLKKYPKDVIMTIDDDRIYSKNLCELMWEEHLKYPRCIICPVGRKYGKKIYECYDIDYFGTEFCIEIEDFGIFEGFAGVLYPPHCLHADVFNFDLFKTLTPYADDIWFQIMAIKSGTKVKAIRSHDKNIIWPKEISGTQAVGLFRKHLRANDVMLKRALIYMNLQSIIGWNCSTENVICPSCKRKIDYYVKEPINYKANHCSVCLNSTKKKILCIGSYDYGNLGDYAYKHILSYYLDDNYDVKFIPDTVRISNKGHYIPFKSHLTDWDFDTLIIGGGGILCPWENNNSIKYYLDHCLKLSKQFFFISVGIQWNADFNLDKMVAYLQPISKYINTTSLCSVRRLMTI